MPQSTMPSESPAAASLRLAVKWSGWFLVAHGCLQLLLGPYLSYKLSLRYLEQMLPLHRGLGLTDLVLGILVLRAIPLPQHQYLAVDLLLLKFAAGVAYLIYLWLAHQTVFLGEWTLALMQASLAVWLWAKRTKGREMLLDQPGSQDAKLLVALLLENVARRQPSRLVRAAQATQARREARTHDTLQALELSEAQAAQLLPAEPGGRSQGSEEAADRVEALLQESREHEGFLGRLGARLKAKRQSAPPAAVPAPAAPPAEPSKRKTISEAQPRMD